MDEESEQQERRPTTFYELLVQATPRFWVTPALVAANVLYFLLGVVLGVSPLEPGGSDLIQLGANFGPRTLGGEWWRILSSTFVHIGFIHLAFNMWCLWSLGNVAERMFGNTVFLLVYVASGLGGSLASLLWRPYIISAGASGAIFGLAGGLAAFLYIGHILVPPRIVRDLLGSLLFFVGFNLLFGVLWEGVDNAGHLGGLVVGASMGAILHRSLPHGARPWSRFLVVPAVALLLLGAGALAYERGWNDPRLLAANALQHRAAGDEPSAIAELERAVALDPTFVEGFLALGQTHLEANRFDEAAVAFEKAAALSPESAPVKTDLGVAYMRGERYDQAIATFREAVELDPQLYAPQRNLGIALALAGRSEEAGEALAIARQMEPSDVSMYVVSSSLLLDADRLDEAVAVLEEALTWAPESAEVHSAMGLARLRRGEMIRAISSLEKSAALEPDVAEHHNRLALALARAGEGDRALRSIEKALELSQGSPHLLDSLGTVRYYRGELAQAVESYRQAISRTPDEAVYHFNVSVALARLGRAAEAEAARAEALRLDPSLRVPEDGQPII